MKRLPDSELEIMQAIWSFEPPVYRTDIESILKDVHPMAPTTLFTLLTRLADKGFIKIEKNGRSAQYIPLITKQEYLATQSKRFIDFLCNGNMSTFANALCDSGISKEDLEELKLLLERKEL